MIVTISNTVIHNLLLNVKRSKNSDVCILCVLKKFDCSTLKCVYMISVNANVCSIFIFFDSNVNQIQNYVRTYIVYHNLQYI